MARGPWIKSYSARFAQCSALFPMMQFSLAPWRMLDDRHLAAVLAAVHTRQAGRPICGHCSATPA